MELCNDVWVFRVRVVGVSRVVYLRLTRVLPRNQIVEDSEAISTVRVCDIVSELSELSVLGANIGIERRSNGSGLEIVPVGVAIRARCMVVANDVVGVGDPECSRGLVSIQQTPGATHVHNQVALDQVFGLNRVFDKDGVTHSVISNIVLNTKVVDAMDSHGSVERVMDSVVTDV